MPSSLTLGCSRCARPVAWRANPDVETTDWRARRGRTAQRVRREGTAVAVPYPYPSTLSGHRALRIPDVQRTDRAALNERSTPMLKTAWLSLDHPVGAAVGYPF